VKEKEVLTKKGPWWWDLVVEEAAAEYKTRRTWCSAGLVDIWESRSPPAKGESVSHFFVSGQIATLLYYALTVFQRY